jgi:hypothetical protein
VRRPCSPKWALPCKAKQSKGFKVNTGIIVDGALIGAPSATKNADKARDPVMHQTRKGQQWYFGMKLHSGVDSQSGLAHSAVVSRPTCMKNIRSLICFIAINSVSLVTRPMPVRRN